MQVLLLIALILGLAHMGVTSFFLMKNDEPPTWMFVVSVLVTFAVLVLNAIQADKEDEGGAEALEILAAILAAPVILYTCAVYNNTKITKHGIQWHAKSGDFTYSGSKVTLLGVSVYTLLTAIAFGITAKA